MIEASLFVIIAAAIYLVAVFWRLRKTVNQFISEYDVADHEEDFNSVASALGSMASVTADMLKMVEKQNEDLHSARTVITASGKCQLHMLDEIKGVNKRIDNLYDANKYLVMIAQKTIWSRPTTAVKS